MLKLGKLVMLSHVINDKVPLYANKGKVVFEKISAIENGDYCNALQLSFPNHIGTHVDLPLHFIDGGLSVSDFQASDWFFNKVCLKKVQVKAGGLIKKGDIGDIGDCSLLLIKTGFEKYRKKEVYWKNSPALEPKLAVDLKKISPSLRAVGIDFISVSNINRRQEGRKAHRSFLEKGIILVEDMRLSPLKRIPEAVIVAPLLLFKGDGAPCTVLGIGG